MKIQRAIDLISEGWLPLRVAYQLVEGFEPSFFGRFRPGAYFYTRDELKAAGLGMVMTRMSTARSFYRALAPFYRRKGREYGVDIFQDHKYRTLGVIIGTQLSKHGVEVPWEMLDDSWIKEHRLDEVAFLRSFHNHPSYETSAARYAYGEWSLSLTDFPRRQLWPSPDDVKIADSLYYNSRMYDASSYLIGPDGCACYYPPRKAEIYLPRASTQSARTIARLYREAAKDGFRGKFIEAYIKKR